MLGSNLKFLRKHHSLSQQDLADKLSLPRTTLGDYERSHTEPNINMMQKIAKTFDISLDQLLKTKLNKSNINIGRSNDFKVLAITVDSNNHSNIELVETKAAAGYLDGCTDPEFIKDLPKIVFPNVPSGTYRGFEIKGDSMLPLEAGSIVICSFIERLAEIKSNKTYVVVSKENGVVYKRLNNLSAEKSILLSSDNETYRPYKLPYNEIEEVWQYYAHLSFSDTYSTFNTILDEKLSEINRKVTEIHSKVLN